MSSGYDSYFKQAKKKKPAAKPSAKPKAKAAAKPKRKVRQRNSQGMGLGWVLMMLFLFGIFATGYMNLDEVDRMLAKVEVNFIAPALAAAEKAADKGLNKANVADPKTSAAVAVCEEKEKYSDEEVSHFSKLNDRKRELDLREEELNALEEELHKQRAEVENRIVKLEQIRTDISGTLNEKVTIDEKRVKTLVDFYSNMKPKKAADVFNNLNEDLAVEVLGRMKKKNAAEIMNLLEPKKAKILSEKYTGYKRR